MILRAPSMSVTTAPRFSISFRSLLGTLPSGSTTTMKSYASSSERAMTASAADLLLPPVRTANTSRGLSDGTITSALKLSPLESETLFETSQSGNFSVNMLCTSSRKTLLTVLWSSSTMSDALRRAQIMQVRSDSG